MLRDMLESEFVVGLIGDADGALEWNPQLDDPPPEVGIGEPPDGRLNDELGELVWKPELEPKELPEDFPNADVANISDIAIAVKT